MKITGLFAGIGGIELGFAQSGHDTVLLCENNSAARAVLDARFPAAVKHDDVQTLKSLPPETEVLTAGFPCQDLSQAGLTRGIDGARSGLVSHVFRLIDQNAVPLVVLENVSFMLRLDRGRAMATLVAAFEERGYRWAYRVVNSLAFLPQRRERVYFVASKGEINPAGVLFSDESQPQPTVTTLDTHAHGFYWTEGVRGLGWAPDAVPTLKAGSAVGIPSPPAILMPDGVVIKPDMRDAERLQGFEADWTLPAETVARSAARWGLIGNAVSVPAAAWLGRRLAEPGVYDLKLDRGAPGEVGWPKAARGEGGRTVSVAIGAFPEFRSRPHLHEFLHLRGSPLSARATRGFLSRADASRLRFEPGFLDRVRKHLASLDDLAIAAE